MVGAALALLWRFYLGLPGWADLALAAGIVIYWPLQEWAVHRYLLHMKPVTVRGRSVLPIQVRNHQLHHRDPWRLDVLFIYKGAFKYALPVIVGLFWLLTRDWPLTATGVGAYLLVLLRYEWTHYLTHTPYQPRSRWYRKRYLNHRRHHFLDEQRMFGVTALVMDKALGTAGSKLRRPAD